MPIKWSAVKVSEAMDEVEAHLNEAQPFINRALATVREARRLPDLAGYMDDRLTRVEWDIQDRFARLKGGVASVRNAIPAGAIEADRADGKTPGLF